MATSINLAPGTQYLIEARKRRRRLLIISAGIVVVTALVFFGLLLYQSTLDTQISGVQDKIRNVDGQIAELENEAKRIVLFENRLRALDILLNAHVSWNPFFTDLERLLPATTIIKSLDVAADDGKVSLTGITPDVDSSALLLASFLSSQAHPTIFQTGKLGNVARTETRGDGGQVTSVSYQFSANLSFNPSILQVNK